MAKAKQTEIPGMEDRGLEDLNSAARDYAEVRDERMELTERESGLKAQLLGLMNKHNKKSYVFDGIEIHIVPGEETVKVKVRSEPKEQKDKTESATA